MSAYSHLTIVAIPESLADVGALVGKALDPDTGGNLSFELIQAIDSNDSIWLIAATPCVPDFAAQTQAMAGNAPLLFGACSAAYAARWPGLVPPTLSECESFVEVAKVWVGERECFGQGSQLDGVLAVWGMVRTVTELEA